MSYKLKRRLALLILIVGLPVYIIVIVNLISSFDRPSFLVELLIYLLSGVVWAFPLKSVFRGCWAGRGRAIVQQVFFYPLNLFFIRFLLGFIRNFVCIK